MSTDIRPPTGSVLLDVNKGPQILGAVATTTILACIVAVMRLYVRTRMIHAVGFDDYFIIAATTCSLAAFVVTIPDVTIYGAGRHAIYISPPSNITTGLKLNFVIQPIMLSGVTFVKVSIGFFLLRIAPNDWYRRSLIGVNTFLLVITTFFVITLFVQCKPLAAVWDLSLRPTAKCWDPLVLRKMCYVNSSLNVATDLCFAFLPWPILWNLRLNKRVKMVLLGVMSLGLFACAAGIVKLTILPSYGRSGDFLYDSAGLTIWTAAELNIGVLASSIPCLKPLLKIILQKSGCSSESDPMSIPDINFFMQSSNISRKQEADPESRGERVESERVESEIEITTFG
ncbi:hypothetical protein BGZ60DRAFT_528324 [Tricladium varicosporioides]|nr:hypothetical protein BGZ60DRAFT_528324 [Hymenoscyphus varicosporioides]